MQILGENILTLQTSRFLLDALPTQQCWSFVSEPQWSETTWKIL